MIIKFGHQINSRQLDLKRHKLQSKGNVNLYCSHLKLETQLRAITKNVKEQQERVEILIKPVALIIDCESYVNAQGNQNHRHQLLVIWNTAYRKSLRVLVIMECY